jgi:hypothetical protein
MADPLDPIRGLDPLGSTPATVSGQTRHAFAEAIMASMAELSTEPLRPRRYVPSRRLVVAGTLAAAGVLLVTGAPWSQPSRALAFTDEGDYFVVRVLDVEADADQYNEEFEHYGLDIELQVVPVSPSLVGTDVGGTFSEEATGIVIEHAPVPVLRIPHDFRGKAAIMLGRAAQPDEQYDVAGQIDGRGEPLAGLKWRNETVSDVREQLARRNTVIEDFRFFDNDRSKARHGVPDDWYVTEGVPWKPGEVLLWVSPHPAR